MAWVAVDNDGREMIFGYKPERIDWNDYKRWVNSRFGDLITLPKGSIKKLIGRPLTWKDEPVEIK